MEIKLNTHEGFVWNYARITIREALREQRKNRLDSTMLQKMPPRLDSPIPLPLNLPRESPEILAMETYSDIRPHVYISNALSTEKASQVAVEALWAIVREMYLNPHYDRADLSDWIADDLEFTLIFVSRRFLAEHGRGEEVFPVVDPTFTSAAPDMLLGFGSFYNHGFEEFPGLR